MITGCQSMEQEKEQKEIRPMWFGVDDAGHWFGPQGMDRWEQDYWYEAIRSLGCNFVMTHFALFAPGDAEDEAAYFARRLQKMDAKMRAHGLNYNLNLEDPNFAAYREVDPGKNEFETPDGMHRWDLRMEWIETFVRNC